MGYGKKILVADRKIENAEAISKTLVEAGFDATPFKTDISSRASVLELLLHKKKVKFQCSSMRQYTPSQSTKEHILEIDLYGTAILLEEVGKVIKSGGTAVTISSQSGYRMAALTADEDRLLATTPTEDLLQLEMLQPENIKDTLHAYQMAKRCNGKRVMAEAVKWGERGVRINAISPGSYCHAISH